MVVHGSQPRPPEVIYEQCLLIWESMLAVQYVHGVENYGSPC